MNKADTKAKMKANATLDWIEVIYCEIAGLKLILPELPKGPLKTIKFEKKQNHRNHERCEFCSL